MFSRFTQFMSTLFHPLAQTWSGCKLYLEREIHGVRWRWGFLHPTKARQQRPKTPRTPKATPSMQKIQGRRRTR